MRGWLAEPSPSTAEWYMNTVAQGTVIPDDVHHNCVIKLASSLYFFQFNYVIKLIRSFDYFSQTVADQSCVQSVRVYVQDGGAQDEEEPRTRFVDSRLREGPNQ